ncbi:MAG: aminopeptidase [Erysipelotrichaceae bacterium]|nr:aminopeptidase [Erysipelotrichaceae bacterium]
MKDNRLTILAHILLDHSLQIEKGDNFVLKAPYSAKPLILEIVNYANEIEANAFVTITDQDITRKLMQGINKETALINNEIETLKFSKMKGLITIREEEKETDPIDIETLTMIGKINKPLNDTIINEKRWVLLEWPTELAAQKVNMSYEQYYDFVLDVCTLDYVSMGKKAQVLKDLMEKTDKVRIVGPNTDLSLSIKDCKAVICRGERNIPDGEVYVGPIKNSINGKITYNVKTKYQGKSFENICFEFKDGKIIKASANAYNKALNKILDIDEGARYIGEFSLGFNPIIKKEIGNILFDEKMCGSFHLTPGQCYKRSNNGNNSQIHWDLVCSQLEEFGGGQIYFDDVLIRDNGIFVLEELKCLNPDKLLKRKQ